jgi:AcrR family transcriptional regulator
MRESESRTPAAGIHQPAGKARLDRRTILEAGAEFVDRHGVQELSMRRLGASLGVEGMSLYRHVPSRENLLDGIVDLMMDELYGDPEVLLEPQHGWQDYLVRLAHGLRRMALAHPRIFPLVATRPPEAPWVRPPLRSLRWIDSFLGALTSSGFSEQAAVAAYRAFSSFLLGHLLLEVAARGVETGPAGTDGGHPGGTGDLSDYPQVLRLQDLLSEDRSGDEFEASLDNLLERLDTLIR